MARSFFISSTSHEDVRVKQLHINGWWLSGRNQWIEFGLFIQMKLRVFLATGQDGVLLKVNSPYDFHPRSRPKLLWEELNSDNSLGLLFNDNLKRTEPLSLPGQSKATFVDFASEKDFILINPTLQNVGTGDFTLRIDKNGVDIAALEALVGRLNEDESDVNECNLNLYCRIRFRAKSNNNVGMHVSRGALKSEYVYDLRVNEVRSIPDAVDASNVVPIEDVYVFLMHPPDHSLHLKAQPKLKYVRVLEDSNNGWSDYFPELQSSPRRLLVYYWKYNREAKEAKDSVHALAAFSVERSRLLRTFALVLVIASVSSILLQFPSVIDPEKYNGFLKAFIQFISPVFAWAGVSGSVIAATIILNSIWAAIAGVTKLARSKWEGRHGN